MEDRLVSAICYGAGAATAWAVVAIAAWLTRREESRIQNGRVVFRMGRYGLVVAPKQYKGDYVIVLLTDDSRRIVVSRECTYSWACLQIKDHAEFEQRCDQRV